MDEIYLDNNATTRVAPEVVAGMLPYFNEFYGNPSSIHRAGQRARKALDDARMGVCGLIDCNEVEFTFTGGGTESVNTAIRGILAARAPRRKIITSTVEHSATRELCQQLQREGIEVVWVEVDGSGQLNMDQLVSALDEQTALVSLIWANNETGVISPIEQVAALCQEKKIPIHCDGTQAVGKIPIHLRQVPINAMSFTPHKFHGPKGIGGLYIRRGTRMKSLLLGGPQEMGRRGGTENVPSAIGFGIAAQLAKTSLEKLPQIAALRDRLESSILRLIPETRVNGSVENRVGNTTNISFRRLEAEAILLLLSEKGVCASAGSACSSGSLEASQVIKAMKVDETYAHGAIRFSLSRYTTEAEINYALEVLPIVIQKLRAVLPV